MGGYHGYFLWHELMTTGPSGAKSFYPAAVGWTITPGGIPNLDYDMWTTPDGFVGGVMQLPQEAQDMGSPSHWIPYGGTNDIEETFRLAVELGARTYVPVTTVPNVGRFAMLADPQGATFAIYQPMTPADASAKAEIGQFSWHELITTDAPAALAFYSKLFGWAQTSAHDMGPMGTYHLYGRDGHELGGMFNKPADMPFPPHWVCYVRVDNADAAAARVTAAGGTVMNGPMDVPGGDRIAQCMDPQGAAFAVHSTP
jgi:predicted enzyme related to lactoylglutathione lyase